MNEYKNTAKVIASDADRYDINAPGHTATLLKGILFLLGELCDLSHPTDEGSK